ncbi:MAG TPA: YfhO family protein [Candidatus Saccharimonadales bacterium]|nr:YfhO family protein [Candidatus Saccharimonadales bacterium]
MKKLDRLIKRVNNLSYLFPLIAFLLPFIFYFGVFFGRSFGLECATGVMGTNSPYQQTVVDHTLCNDISDSGAFAWNHGPLNIKSVAEYSQFKLPLWNQNNGIGVPLAANFISSAYYLPNLFFSSFKSVFAFDLYFILRMSIASLGMYLFLRTFKLSKLLCLIGSVIIFLNGYVTYIPTISHLNVDILLPWIAFLIAKAFETRKIKYFIFLAFVTALSHLGGMPESSVFVALFYVAFSLFLVLFIEKTKKLPLLFLLTGSFLLSFLLASILIVPGAEYLKYGFSYHQPGQSQPHSIPPQHLVFLAFPKIFGSLWGSLAYQPLLSFPIYNLEYIGSFTTFIFLNSIAFLFLYFNKLKSDKNFKYLAFFIVFLSLMLAQYYGFLEIPLFTKLPGFSQTNFPKYSLTLINLLFASITVLTIDFIVKYKTKIVPAISFVIFSSISLFLFLKLRSKALSLGTEKFEVLIMQLALSEIVVILTTLVLFFSWLVKRKWLIFTALLIICGVELFLYIPNRGDLMRRDSYRQPPFINYLRKQSSENFRTFSPDQILYPNLNAIYNINDVRNLDAIWPKTYYDYLKEFVVPDIDKTAMRLTGIREGNTKDAKLFNNTFFDLLSVKYMLSYNDINSFEDLQEISPYLDQVQDTQALKKDFFTIEGQTKPILFEHPPHSVSLKMTKPISAKYFYLYPALSDKVFNKKNSGDGVRFIAKIKSDEKVISQQAIAIDPKSNKSDQKWSSIKLGPIDTDKNLSLTLQTDPLSSANFDWAGWGGFLWDTQSKRSTPYQYNQVYNKEIKVSENSNFVPRLHPIEKIICVSKEDQVFPEMRKDEQMIKTIGIGFGPTCKARSYSKEVSVSHQNFIDQSVTFNYSSPHNAYIMLSNQYYPGWELTVNGKKVPIERVNYTFQGFELAQGQNVKVELTYHSKSTNIGLFITLISLATSAYLIVKLGERKLN